MYIFILLEKIILIYICYLLKRYVDSRHKTVDSVSDSNFKYELPYTLHMPHNACFYITDFCIPNCWRTIDAGMNDKLYYNIGNIPIIQDPEGSFVSGTDCIATMP